MLSKARFSIRKTLYRYLFVAGVQRVHFSGLTHTRTHARSYIPLPSPFTNMPRCVSRFNQVMAVFFLIPMDSAVSIICARVKRSPNCEKRKSRSALERRLISVEGRNERMCVAWR